MAEQPDTVKEAVGIFHDPDKMQAAIDELLMSGFAQGELSLVAGEDTVREKLGQMYGSTGETADDPEVPRVEYVAPESRGNAEGGLIGGLMYVGALATAGAVVASGGALAAAIAAAAAAGAGGGLVGAVLARMIEENHADYIQQQLDKGGLVLWVRTADAKHEERATSILKRHSAEGVHVHTIKAS